MNVLTLQDAQRIVAAYLKVAEAHAAADEYPSSLDDLPQSKDTIRSAFRTCIPVLASTGQLTPELRDYLEVAYVSLADYVSQECLTLLREFATASEAFAADKRLIGERVATDAWRQLAGQSRLAGQLASEISADADRLRAEFRAWDVGVATARR